MTLFAIAALAAALAASPTPAEAAPPTPPPADDEPGPAVQPAGSGAGADGVGGPVEPIDFRISSILVEGRKAADESRWTGAVDPALERRYAPRHPRYNQITIEF